MASLGPSELSNFSEILIEIQKCISFNAFENVVCNVLAIFEASVCSEEKCNFIKFNMNENFCYLAPVY